MVFVVGGDVVVIGVVVVVDVVVVVGDVVIFVVVGEVVPTIAEIYYMCLYLLYMIRA